MNKITARQLEDGMCTRDFSDREHDNDRYKVILENLSRHTLPTGIYFFQEVPYGFIEILRDEYNYKSKHYYFVEDYHNSNRGGLLIFTNLWLRAEITSTSPIIVSWQKNSKIQTRVRGSIVNMVINSKEIKLINAHIQRDEHSDLVTILDKIGGQDEEVILGGDLNMKRYDLISIIEEHKVKHTHNYIVFSNSFKCSIDHIVRFTKKDF